MINNLVMRARGGLLSMRRPGVRGRRHPLVSGVVNTALVAAVVGIVNVPLLAQVTPQPATQTIQECKAEARARWRLAFNRVLLCNLRNQQNCGENRIANAIYQSDLALCAALAQPSSCSPFEFNLPCACDAARPEIVWENLTDANVRVTVAAQDDCPGDCPSNAGSYLSYTDAHGRQQVIDVGDPVTGLGRLTGTIVVHPHTALAFFCSGASGQGCTVSIQVLG